jgi:hypothetical protein
MQPRIPLQLPHWTAENVKSVLPFTVGGSWVVSYSEVIWLCHEFGSEKSTCGEFSDARWEHRKFPLAAAYVSCGDFFSYLLFW